MDINQKSACLHSSESIDLLDSREKVDVELSTSMYAEVMAELWFLTLANSCHQYIFESCGSDDLVLSKAISYLVPIFLDSELGLLGLGPWATEYTTWSTEGLDYGNLNLEYPEFGLSRH
ncbi:hypothetical protein CLU79DRAFT_716984 [Phycomyces nitens]|nr:hypothetical protein CLU79DRAFT_716984 [Phycomyces nitens]